MIEDFWADGTAYDVAFETIDSRTIRKTVILPEKIDDLDIVSEVVFKNFSKVKEVINIREIGDCLITKTISFS